jgi:hypothetical protein
MKRGFFLFGILLLASIALVSAQYGSFSLSEILNSVEPSMIILGVIWVVSFALIYFSLNRLILKDNPGIAAVIAFALSLLITWGYNQTGWNVQYLFPGLNISTDFLSSALPIILIIIVAVLFVTTKYYAFTIIGGVCIIAGLLNWVYEKTLLFIIGAILLAVGIFFIIRKNSKDNQKTVLEHLMRPRRKR